ncbi:MAG: AAA family ATPase [Saprospiraceae bacterium]|nr:AAA family ATPase [Saprospiraceae bacterium]
MDKLSNTLIMVLGLPGVGKSFFAREFAKRIGAKHINSDIVRKEVSENPGYSNKEKGQVYDVMFNRVCEYLNLGQVVVVDATFAKSIHRLPYFEHIRKTGGLLKIIQITADEMTVKDRVSVKRLDSDADYAVYQKIKAEYEHISKPSLVLSSSKLTLDEMISRARSYINQN